MWNQLSKLGVRVSTSIVDQAMLSGTHLLINILLVRWLPVAEYGKFAVAYTIITLLNALHLAFVNEPTAILSAKHQGFTNSFFTQAIRINFMFSVVAMALFFLVGAVVFVFEFGVHFEALALATASLALTNFWFFRQAAFVEAKPGRAVLLTFVYCMSLVIGLFVSRAHGELTLPFILALFTVGATLSSFLGLMIYHPRISLKAEKTWKSLLSEFWSYGRWAIPASLMMWIANNVFVVAAPIFTGVQDAARLKAFLNILLPFQHVLLGISQIALPALSSVIETGTRREAFVRARLIFGASLVGGVSVAAILIVSGTTIYETVYGQQYSGDSSLVKYGIALPVLWAIISAMRVILRALNFPKAIFKAYAYSMFSAGLIAIPWGLVMGPEYALLGMSTIQLGVAVCMIWLLALRTKHDV